MTTPRVFLVRHGETEWSLNGQHTGTTELELTANGEKRVLETGKALVGNDRLIVPKNLAHIYVSPRKRAQRTLELLRIGCKERYPWNEQREQSDGAIRTQAEVEITEDIREWDYGAYEGLTTKQIREMRLRGGESENWDIWRDGCPGGASPHQITERLDRLINDLRSRFHANAIGKPKGKAGPCDVLIVAHGHILRAFAARWVKRDVATNPSLIMEAGGVGTLSYEHHSIDEPAILLGGGFMVDIVEEIEQEKNQTKG
ncbi:phosphoglycerate mutase-like protein [Eremomyces bilateralis CBS 781.70]|uniref:Phosphoglycerate mutase-like protein n=1 Tax=Eremomyces bilateralis CBS 781.70 TaxID=1392243 RepID=A0A6G1G3H4_9PEZI|nr:phosphoglycerate mutase-like protein [Eremomyces bilateralis CBS 781.70]KAF1812481.1 phosphoglycerate mutase-like protein [Eremomyces bilateralis CBS 781.70]